MNPKALLIATTNPGKLHEYRELLADLPVRWLALTDVGLGEIEAAETGQTYLDNALMKAREYAGYAHLPTLADDSGVEVDALGGAPGIYSARYGPTAPERIARLLAALEGVPDEKRAARFVCATVLILPDGVTVSAEGVVEGRIGYAPCGANGFGYDPIFVLPDGRTMAELPTEEKGALSHRGRALARIAPILRCIFA